MRELSISIMAMTALFYPEAKPLRRKPWHERFKKAALLARGQDSSFVKQLEAKLTFLDEIDSIRHALVHPDERKWIKFLNYEMQQDGTIMCPTIEVETDKVKIPRMDLTDFLMQCSERMSVVFEAIVCLLCDLNAIKFGQLFAFGVDELPASQRKFGSRYTWQTYKELEL